MNFRFTSFSKILENSHFQTKIVIFFNFTSCDKIQVLRVSELNALGLKILFGFVS